MIKRAGLILLFLLIAIGMFTFTARNTGVMEVDLAFTRVTASIPLAFTVTFVIGWLFGLLSMGVFALRLLRERRHLRRSLKVSESEVTSLRNLPLTDAE